MAKAARFVTEVAPPQVVSVMRRGKKVPRSLDTIAEDDREQLPYGPPSSPSDHLMGFAAAWSRRAPAAQVQARERAAGGFVRELISNSCFSDAHGQHRTGRPAPVVAGRVATS